MSGYYIMYEGRTVGPMTPRQMMAYNVGPQTQVCPEGGQWQPLFSCPELMEAYSAFHKESATRRPADSDDSMRITCGILSLLIGWLGLQYFLIGKVTGGIINIVLSLVTCGLWGVVNFIQGILILTMTEETWRRKFVDSPSTFPIF